MLSKEKWKRFLHDKKWFLLTLIPAAALLWCCFVYIDMTQTPLKSLDISPASDPASWRFTLADGTEVSPKVTTCFFLRIPSSIAAGIYPIWSFHSPRQPSLR